MNKIKAWIAAINAKLKTIMVPLWIALTSTLVTLAACIFLMNHFMSVKEEEYFSELETQREMISDLQDEIEVLNGKLAIANESTWSKIKRKMRNVF